MTKTTYATARGSAASIKRLARLARKPETPSGPPVGCYQLTPQASKGNAFCWLSWNSELDWTRGAGQEAAQHKRNEALEEKRAAGIDPLHVSGLKGAAINLDPKRFAVFSRVRTDESISKSATMRDALRQLGPQTAAELARLVGLSSSGTVGALLAHDRKNGRVVLVGGKYSWVPHV